MNVAGMEWAQATHPHLFEEMWIADLVGGHARASVWKLRKDAQIPGPWRWSAKKLNGRWDYGRADSRDEAMEKAAKTTRRDA